VSVTRSPVVPY